MRALPLDELPLLVADLRIFSGSDASPFIRWLGRRRAS
jgi:hypothetical protein